MMQNSRVSSVTLKGAPLLFSAFALAGCAGATPMQQATLGNLEPLVNQIYAGQIDSNERIMAYSGPQTPLCAIVTSQVHAAAVAKLLKDGADINKSCFPEGTPGITVNALPLDILIRGAAFKNTQNSPYSGNTYSPDRYRFLMGRISQFIDLGAQSYRGQLTMAEVESIVSDDTALGNQFIDQQRQQIAEEKRNSIFSAENLGIFVAAAGGVVNNYAAARNAQLDSARASGSAKTNSRAASSSRTTLTSSSSSVGEGTRPVAKTPVDIVETNPYERFASSPSAWGSAINGWFVSHRVADSRENACSAANDLQAKRIATDESKGYVTVTERTDCICGSFSVLGVNTLPKPQWSCGAYYKTQRTGKQPGTVSR